MRFIVATVWLASGCARVEAEPPPRRGLLLERVAFTTWRGAALSARGTARSATVTAAGFVAEGVALSTAAGAGLKAPQLSGSVDLTRLTAADGASLHTADGCEGRTPGRVEYAAPLVRSEGPVAGQGCGFELSGSSLEYDVQARHARLSGPVRTRIEASR